METIEDITDIAIKSKMDFMYKKNAIPTKIYLDEHTYEVLMEDRDINLVSNINTINFDKFIGLDIDINNSKNLEVE